MTPFQSFCHVRAVMSRKMVKKGLPWCDGVSTTTARRQSGCGSQWPPSAGHVTAGSSRNRIYLHAGGHRPPWRRWTRPRSARRFRRRRSPVLSPRIRSPRRPAPPNLSGEKATVTAFVVRRLIDLRILTDLSANPDGSLVNPDQVDLVCARAGSRRAGGRQHPAGARPDRAAAVRPADRLRPHGSTRVNHAGRRCRGAVRHLTGQGRPRAAVPRRRRRRPAGGPSRSRVGRPPRRRQGAALASRRTPGSHCLTSTATGAGSGLRRSRSGGRGRPRGGPPPRHGLLPPGPTGRPVWP